MEKIKFAHFRNFEFDGAVSNLGGVTMAYTQIGDCKFKVAYSWCSPNDNFNKKVGRIKAMGRLNSDRYSCVYNYYNEKELLAMEKAVQQPYMIKEKHGK
jgi:hypothetical protein